MSVAMKINEELNGIELYFNTKPQQEVLTNLKSNGFRWSGFKKCWYAKQSDKSIQVANNLTGEVKEAVKEIVKKSAPKKQALSLWNATQWEDIKVNYDQDCKEIAKEIRTHIRKRFPQCKFSVTVPYYGKINFSIKSSPFEKGSVYLEAILNYCKELLNTYKHCYDAGDAYSDIPASYNFYGYADIDWDYKQSEVTEEVKNDMKEFDTQLVEFEKYEEERKELEFQAYMKEQEIRNEEYKKQQEEEAKQVEEIYNTIEVKELEESNQYFVTSAEFADLNKNNTLDEYKEEVSKGEYSLENVKVTKEIHFNNQEALENFSNMLLKDFDFLANTGGSFTEDNRINSMLDYNNMDDYKRNTVQWNLYGVAVYYENKLQFVIDAQGYSYARYVGLTDNATIEKEIITTQVIDEEELTQLKMQADILEDISTSVIEELNIIGTWENENWKEYKDNIKNKLKQCNIKLSNDIIQQLEIENLKVTFYKLLKEVDSIQEQFKEAEIQPGEKLTLFYISDWGSIVTHRITFDSIENISYAQYDKAIKLTFTPEGKRKLHYKYFYSTLLVYKGFHSLPETVLYNVEESNGVRVTRSKYHSCDDRQYDEILTYFEQHDIKPIVNTYKLRF